MAKLDNFSKIYNGSKSIAKVYGATLTDLDLRNISTNNQGIGVIPSTTMSGTSVSRLFDGIKNVDTNRWVSNEDDAHPKLTITLDKTYVISQIIIHNGHNGGNNNFVQDVEIIIDGINQGTFVGDKTPIDINFANEPIGKVIELKFPAGYNRIYEIEIYGKKHFSLIWQDGGITGPSILIAGDMEAGFYGEVPASEFVTGDELCSLAGITVGTSQFSNEPWLKFSYLGETVFVAKKPIRYGISWSQINTAGCVFGEKVVTIKGQRYKVTLIKGKTEGKQDDASAYQGSINHNSMWNKLMGQVDINAPSNWVYPSNMESTLVNWGINYTSTDLHMHKDNPTGYLSWCQEYGTSTTNRLMRGAFDVSGGAYENADSSPSISGFRPALILIA